MLVDMHLHECTYSSDSKISLEEIVTTARGRGWTLSASRTMTAWTQGICGRVFRQDRFPIFVGIEFFSLQGISRRGD